MAQVDSVARDANDDNISEAFKKWKRQLTVYMTASGTSEKSNKMQSAVILHCARPQMIIIYEHFEWKNEDGTDMSEEDRNDPANVLRKIEEYCNPRQSEVLQTHRFWSVQWQNPFDIFLTELRNRADACNFEEKDRMIRDKIVFTAKGKIQELLLRDTNLNLKRAIDICRAYEQSIQHAKEMNASGSASHNIDKVSTTRSSHSQAAKQSRASYTRQARQHTRTKQDHTEMVTDCHFCGGNHEKRKSKCPAWGKRVMVAMDLTILK